MQSIAKLETQIDQLVIAFSREEEGELPSQSENDLERQYLIRSFNVPITFSKQMIMILENETIME